MATENYCGPIDYAVFELPAETRSGDGFQLAAIAETLTPGLHGHRARRRGPQPGRGRPGVMCSC